MGDPLKHVSQGDPINLSATAWNAFIDAAKDYQRRRLSGGMSSTPTSRDGTIISLQNNTGSAIGRFSVLSLSGPCFDPPSVSGTNDTDFFNRTAFYGYTPQNSDVGTGKFAVTLAPAGPGDVAAGVFPVILQYPPPSNSASASLNRADVVPGDCTMLAANATGPASVLWSDTVPDGGGTVAAIVRLGDPVPQSPVVVYLTGTNDYKSGFYEGYYLDRTGSIMTCVTVQNAAEAFCINPAAAPVHLLDTDIGPTGNFHVGVLSLIAPDNTNRALVTIDTDSVGNTDAGDNNGSGDMVTEWARGDGFGATLTVVIKNYTGGTGLASLRWDAFGHLYYVAIIG